MFGFTRQEAKELGSKGRYKQRIEKFKAKGYRFPRAVHYFWWVLHNVVAHGFLITACPWSFRFHDWTSIKLNAGIADLTAYLNERAPKLPARTDRFGA